MGYKNICLDCRKTFSLGTDFTKFRDSNCPNCGNKMTFVSHRFRPPKITDIKKWETVGYLVENGFRYHHIYKNISVSPNGLKSYSDYVEYPNNMGDAKEFVNKYKDQATLDL